MFITENDNKVLKFLEDHKALTLNQIYRMFFKDYKYASRRMKQLEINNKVKSYELKVPKFQNKIGKKTYYINKKLTFHDILINEFCTQVIQKGGQIIKLKYAPYFKKFHIMPDALIYFIYGNKLYMNFLEVDVKHITSITKLKLYEKLAQENIVQNMCFGKFPDIVILRENTNNIQYNSKYFHTIFLDFNYSQFNQLILNLK